MYNIIILIKFGGTFIMKNMPKTAVYIPPEKFPVKGILEHFDIHSAVAINGAIHSYGNPCLISEKMVNKLKLTASQIHNVGWTYEMYWRPTGNMLMTMIKIIQRPDKLYFVSTIVEGATNYSFPITPEHGFAFYLEDEQE